MRCPGEELLLLLRRACFIDSETSSAARGREVVAARRDGWPDVPDETNEEEQETDFLHGAAICHWKIKLTGWCHGQD